MAAASIGAVVATADDLIDRRGASAPVRGEITNANRTEVTVKIPTKPEVKIPANEITRVRFNGEKPQINLVRSEEAAGRLAKALDGYRDALRDVPANQSALKADLEFLIARTTAKLAAEDPKLLGDAARELERFRSAHPDHFRDFEALSLLGNVQLLQNDFAKARATFRQLSEAPWSDVKLTARNAEGRILLAENKIDEAVRAFEESISAAGDNAAHASQRVEAMLGKATALEKKSEYAEAAKILEGILEQSSENNSAVQAQACVRLGGAYQAAGNVRDALLAYLRVDVLYFNEKAWHAEALYHLSQLWARDGKPDRAADAATVLQAKYSQSEWAKKLSSKSATPTQ